MDERGPGSPRPNEDVPRGTPDGAGLDPAVAPTPPPGAPSPTVPTEAVEPPSVRLASPPEPAGPRRVGSGLSVIVGVLAIVAIGAVGAYGYSLDRDLGAARSTLASTVADLDATTATLEDTDADLAATTTELSAATDERISLDGTIAELSAAVEDQTECVELQSAALDELARISDLQTDNFNRTAENSTWDKSAQKRANAVDDALDAYYEAYSKAFDGNLSSARGWAQKGKDAQTVIAAQATQQAAELALIDRSAAEIEAALDALEQQLASIERVCGQVAP